MLQFEGQTKGKLGTSEARSSVDAVISEKLAYFLEENPDVSSLLVKKQSKLLKRVKRHVRREKTQETGKTKASRNRSKREVDACAIKKSSAKRTVPSRRGFRRRFSKTRKGSPLSSCAAAARESYQYRKAKLQDIFKNEEISTIIHAIGGGVGADFTIDDINYDKIVIMTDADTDGAHIQVLLLTFFYRYMKPLVEAGKVFIALPPLYKVSKGSGKRKWLNIHGVTKSCKVLSIR